MSTLTNNIGKSDVCIDDFFERRIGRCGDLVAQEITTSGTHGDLNGMAERGQNKDGGGPRVIKGGMAMDMRGVPPIFHFYLRIALESGDHHLRADEHRAVRQGRRIVRDGQGAALEPTSTGCWSTEGGSSCRRRPTPRL